MFLLTDPTSHNSPVAEPWAKEGGDDAERRDADRAGRGRVVGRRDACGVHVIVCKCTFVGWVRSSCSRAGAPLGVPRDGQDDTERRDADRTHAVCNVGTKTCQGVFNPVTSAPERAGRRCVTRRKLQTPGTAEEHKKNPGTPTINPIGPTDKPHRPRTKHYRKDSLGDA